MRVLGVFALIDEGELDWKVVCINKEEADKKNVKSPSMPELSIKLR